MIRSPSLQIVDDRGKGSLQDHDQDCWVWSGICQCLEKNGEMRGTYEGRRRSGKGAKTPTSVFVMFVVSEVSAGF